MNGPIEQLAESDKELLQKTLNTTKYMESCDSLYYKKPGSPVKFFVQPITEDEWHEIDPDNVDLDECQYIKVQCEVSQIEHSEDGLIFNNDFKTMDLDITCTFDIDGNVGWTDNSEFGLFMKTSEFILTEWPLEEAQKYFNGMETERQKNFYSKLDEIQEKFESSSGPEWGKSNFDFSGGFKLKPENDSYKYDNYEFEKEQGKMNDPDLNGFGHCRH